MKTLAVIFILALTALAGEFYTDMQFTSAQPNTGELPIMQGQTHAPVLGF